MNDFLIQNEDQQKEWPAMV